MLLCLSAPALERLVTDRPGGGRPGEMNVPGVAESDRATVDALDLAGWLPPQPGYAGLRMGMSDSSVASRVSVSTVMSSSWPKLTAACVAWAALG